MKRLIKKLIILALLLVVIMYGSTRYAQGLLFDALNDEVTASTPCELKSDIWSVNLFTLSAYAKNARVVCPGEKVVMSIPEITASFNLKKISKNKIVIDPLILNGGDATGLLPGSEGYAFINRLAAPSKNPTSGGVKVRLENFYVKNVSLTHAFTNGSKFLSKDASMHLIRHDSDAVSIETELNDNTFQSESFSVPLTSIDAKILSTDDLTTIESLRLKGDSINLTGDALIELIGKENISGKALGKISSKNLFDESLFSGNIDIESLFKGTLNAPRVEVLASSSMAHIKNIGSAPVSVKADLNFSEDLDISIHEANLKNSEILFSSVKVKTSPFSATGEVTLNNFSTEGIKLSGRSFFAVSKEDKLNASLQSNLESVSVKGVVLPPLSLQASYDGEKFQGEIKNKEETVSIAAFFNNKESKAFGSFKDFHFQNIKTSGTISAQEILTVPVIDGKFTSIVGNLPPVDVSFKGTAENLSGIFSTNNLLGDFSLKNNRATLNLEADRYQVSKCKSISTSLTYTFPLSEITLGDGIIKHINFIPDCNESPLSLSPSLPMVIKKGNISLNGRSLEAYKTKLAFTGDINLKNGYSLTAIGDAEAGSLGILSQFDNVSGTLQGTVQITGPLLDPSFKGEISVQNGSVEQESSNMIIDEVSGIIFINPNDANFNNIKGNLNGGEVLLSGRIPIESTTSGEVNVQFKDSFFQLDSSTSFEASGDLQVKTLPVAVSGGVTVHTGDFIKSFNLKAFIRERYESLFSNKTLKTESLPNIPVDVHLVSPGQFFINSNLLDAELKADLFVQGTLAEPKISGKIETVSASAGLRGRRFDISLGEMIFTPESNIPYVRFFGEASLMPAQLDSVLVLLQIEGPLSKPSVEFISDRNLSQSEIIKLITGGQTSSEVTEYSGGSGMIDASDNISINDTLPFFQLPSFIDSLTRIDSIAIEPRYDPYTGNNEPLVIARKKLLKDLELVGQSVWGSTRQTASARLIYNLTPRTNLVGVARTLPTRKGLLLGGDVTFTVLSRRPNQIKVAFEGLRNFSEAEMLDVLNLNSVTVLPKDSFHTIEKRITQYFIQEGFINANTKISCVTNDEYCKNIIIHIFEGGQKLFKDVIFTDEPLPSYINIPFPDSPIIASSEHRDEIIASALVALRNEGYVGARIKGFYECSDFCTLKISLKKGKPISFLFSGHSHFKELDFLNSIRLFARKTPLGSNTPNILLQNIIDMYKEAGFPFVKVTKEKEEFDGERITYIISIEEGPKITINNVTVTGVTLSESEIKETLLRLLGPSESNRFFSKSIANKSTIDAKEQFLNEVLIAHGYEGISISRSILPISKNEASLSFDVTSTSQMLSNCIIISGSPTPIEKDCSFPVSFQTLKAKELDTTLHIKNQGYREVTSTSEFHPDGDSIIHIVPGEITRLGKIIISGNKSISDDIINSEISSLKEGDVLSTEKLRTIQENLLKLGLFQRVIVKEIPKGSTTDIQIELQERPLQTLEIGTGYSTGLGFHLFGEASDRALFSDGKVLSLRLDTFIDSNEINEGIASLRFIEPTVFGSKYSFIAETSVEIQNLPTFEFDLNRNSLGTSIYRNFENQIGTSVGILLLNEDLKNVSKGAIISPLDSGNVVLGIFNADLTYDGRDNALLPTKGGYINLEGFLSDPTINSDAEYFGGNIKGTYSIPLTDRWSIFTAGSYGKKITFGDTDFVPITQRYYLGGRGSLRGYTENSLGARGEDGSVIGGEELVRGNIELHYLLYEEVSLQSFYDIGKLSIPDIASPLEEYVSGAGVGIRYLSPIGPVGFDLAHGLDDVPGSRNIRFTFEIGINF